MKFKGFFSIKYYYIFFGGGGGGGQGPNGPYDVTVNG